MDSALFRARFAKMLTGLPLRLYRALPAVFMSTLFNVLDAVSTGILIFPTDDSVFRALQLQGAALYIMSTIISQLVISLGGSKFHGGAGSMLLEILPFLRGVATDIREVLGEEHPGLIPTVMAAYALSSFLTGALFMIMGLLKSGALVAYFPQTVLTGAIGAIGVSLCVLGLGLPFPSTVPPLSLSNAGTTLFAKSHLPLLAATVVPSVMLCLSLRSRSLEVATRGATRSPFYIPTFFLTFMAAFWIVVKSARISNGMLVDHAWLFQLEFAPSGTPTWNYWVLFDFKRVEWWALKSAIQNMVVLVVIGVLNLPIYVPTIAFSLDVSYDMNFEFFGTGLANIFAGVVGTVPNIIQYSYTVYITRAKGGRFEMGLVTLLTAVLFFFAGNLLPYIPTILASTVVLFIGIELSLEAIWESSKTLAWMEYAVVMSTLFGCTFLGFAEGFGVGIGSAALVFLVYGVMDSPAQVTRWNEWNELQQIRDYGNPERSSRDYAETGNSPVIARFPAARTQAPPAITLGSTSRDIRPQSAEPLAPANDVDTLLELNTRVVVLPGYVFFASVPSLESSLLSSVHPPTFFVLDLSNTHRIETAAARCLPRFSRDLEPKSSRLVLCGVRRGTGLHADFVRAETRLAYDDQPAAAEDEGKPIRAFESRAECLAWCQAEQQKQLRVKDDGLSMDEKESAFQRLSESSAAESWSSLARFEASGGEIRLLLPGQVLLPFTGTVFVVEGQLSLLPDPGNTPSARGSGAPAINRTSVQRLVAMLPGEALKFVRSRLRVMMARDASVPQVLGAGDQLDLSLSPGRAVAKTRTVLALVNSHATR
ncbi:unnamed protein product [Mycena citricolor]|uniref:STAS domain-containing protein n=1 Tax=Mycena citricolor TaxID=2018698 RepID=A0AAD2HTX5_9AGAR|nr:unnamed protein product [Mycena citricolor]CAK5282194.1 unnamed protein product [Mycena citricolor]